MTIQEVSNRAFGGKSAEEFWRQAHKEGGLYSHVSFTDNGELGITLSGEKDGRKFQYGIRGNTIVTVE
jgi:hypothetical protein